MTPTMVLLTVPANYVYLFVYLCVYIQRSIIGNKPLAVEFVNIYNKHIMILYKDKYQTSYCIHSNEIS